MFADDPVTRIVSVPADEWTIAAMPKGGWDAALTGRWWARLIILLAGALVVAPAWLAGRLLEERRAHFNRLAERESELERLSRRLELALDASKVGVWDFNIDTQRAGLGRPDERALRLSARRRRRADTGTGETGSTRPTSNAPSRTLKRRSAASGRYNRSIRLNLGDGRTRVIRAIGKVYIAPDLSRQMVGVNWDVTADVKLTEDLTHSMALTRGAQRRARSRARRHRTQLAARLSHPPAQPHVPRARA